MDTTRVECVTIGADRVIFHSPRPGGFVLSPATDASVLNAVPAIRTLSPSYHPSKMEEGRIFDTSFASKTLVVSRAACLSYHGSRLVFNFYFTCNFYNITYSRQRSGE